MLVLAGVCCAGYWLCTTWWRIPDWRSWGKAGLVLMINVPVAGVQNHTFTLLGLAHTAQLSSTYLSQLHQVRNTMQSKNSLT